MHSLQHRLSLPSLPLFQTSSALFQLCRHLLYRCLQNPHCGYVDFNVDNGFNYFGIFTGLRVGLVSILGGTL